LVDCHNDEGKIIGLRDEDFVELNGCTIRVCDVEEQGVSVIVYSLAVRHYGAAFHKTGSKNKELDDAALD
jgi:hypothetical protein